MRAALRTCARTAVIVALVAAVWAAIARVGPFAPQEEPRPVAEEPGTAGHTPLAEAARVVAATRPALERAFQLLAVHDWDGCLAPFQAAAEAFAPHPLLGGLRDQCLYNVACAYARTGRPAEAVRALAASVEHGLRPVASPSGDGRVVLGPGLSFAHVLADPDLDALRERGDFRAVLDGLLRAGTPLVEATAAALGDAPLPGVLVVLDEDRDVADGAAGWRAALSDVPAVVAVVEGPVRPAPHARRWLLLDGDDRFAVAKITEALDALRADERVDGARVVLAAASPAGGEAALAAALARPADVAGLALGPFRFHAAWHADALHDLRAARGDAPAWKVACVAPGGDAARDLQDAGVALERLEPPPTVVAPGARGAALRDVVLDAVRRLLR